MSVSVSLAGGNTVTWTLADVKRIALENNPDIKAAKANFEAAQKVIGESVSGYLPHVNVNARYEQTTLPSPSAGSSALLGISEPYTFVTAEVDQLLYDFGKTISRIDSSSALSRSAEQQAIAVKNLVDLSIEKAFYDVAAADKLVEVAEKGVEQFSETHRRAEILVRTGAKPQFDLSQANVELSKAKLNLIRVKNARDLSRIGLLNLLGMQRLVKFRLADQEIRTDIHASDLDLDALIMKGLDHRPEMKSSEYAAESAHYDHQASIRDYFPTISANAWYGKYLPEYPAALRDSWGAGVSASWPLFTGLATTFRTSELAARAEQKEALVEKERADIAADVSASYMALERAESNLQVAQETFDFSQENLHFAKSRYNAAIATILELLIAETSSVNAQAGLVEARYRFATALAALEKAVNAPLVEPSKH